MSFTIIILLGGMKSFVKIACIFFFIFIKCNQGVNNNNGKFIFTSSKNLFSGRDERMCLSLYNVTGAVNVQVLLLEQKGHSQIASATRDIDADNSGGKCFDLTIPRTKSKKGRLALTISFLQEDYSVNYYEQISINQSPDVVYILTDKVIYTGGQSIKFRIFIIGSDLIPVEENVERIWIENPHGVHIAQWLNQSTSHGFIDKSFLLSREPLTGIWNIKVKRQLADVASQEFIVENYVLPRFSVLLHAPKSINASESFNISICGRYLFGQPVRGTAVLHVYVKCSFSFYCNEDDTSLTQQLTLSKDGCALHRIRLTNTSSFAQKIIVNATVREDGTGFKAASATAVDILAPVKGSPFEFSHLTKKKTFKPGLPFKGRIVCKSRLTSCSDALLCSVINSVKQCKKVTIEKGGGEFLLPPSSVTNTNNYTAYLEIIGVDDSQETGKYYTKLFLVPWYSPTGNYLQLEILPSGTLECNTVAVVNITFSTCNLSELPRFYYMVKSLGNIIEDGSLLPKPSELIDFVPERFNVIGSGDFSQIKQFLFTLNITDHFSINNYLLVYYVTPGGEVVADSLHFPVKKCLKSLVKLRWSKNQSFPGDSNKLEIKTVPNSVCALSVNDKSTKFLSKSSGFNEDTVYNSLKKFDVEFRDIKNGLKACSNVTESVPGEETDFYSRLPETYSRFLDSQHAFHDFGAIVISNLVLETRPCINEKKIGRSMGNATDRDFGSVMTYGNKAENIMRPKINEIKEMLLIQQERISGLSLRNFFPETWIWDIVKISESGTAELDVVMPHTITEWESQAVCLSKDNGLGIAEIQKTTSYQPFFLDFPVPHSIKLKEIFHLPVSIFNYENQNLPIKLTFAPTKSFKLKKENSYSDCVKSKSNVVHNFAVEPVLLGEAVITINVEVDANYTGKCGNFTGLMRDSVSKKIVIEHEGYPTEDIKSGFICADNKNFEDEVAWTMKIPTDIVESSASVDALISGDILGPSIENVDNIITLPTGCGEQNMILLAPNILILEYLLLTKSEDTELIERALKNLDLGYQKQLNYRRTDGSYSAFGEKDEKGSIWLTAFVVRYLSQAHKFIHIDKNDLSYSIQWILKHQLENGCFPVIGEIYHRDLKEKFSENDSSKVLTAYIIISLIESGMVSESIPQMKNALYCLRGFEKSSGIYDDLLTAYALLLVGEIQDAQALMFELLKSANRVYGLLWWQTNENSSAESSIEMTAYGILCLLKLGGSYFAAAASDAIKWITQYRNRNGGFVSSQDTILALEATSKLSASLPRMSTSDKLSILLETIDRNVSFTVDQNNLLLQQKYSLPAYPIDVKFTATGKGCALVQTRLKYHNRQGKQNNDLKIQLKIDSLSDIDEFFVTKFDICVRRKNQSGKTTMAVLEVFMVSGFYPDRKSLYDIPISYKGVRKWEEYEDKVVFYFENLKQKKVCLQFLVNQEICVEKTSPASIKLYDYYNNRQFTTVKYNLQPECNKVNDVWLDVLPRGKSESETKLSRDYQSDDGKYRPNDTSLQYHLADVDFDLKTPEEIGPLPVYVPVPINNTLYGNCPSCLNTVPGIFSELYCSARRIFIVKNLGRGLLDIRYDWIPGNNPKTVNKTLSNTLNTKCYCSPLTQVNSTSLVIVTPLASDPVVTPVTPDIKLDESVVIIPIQLGNKAELPIYLNRAIDYCNAWKPVRQKSPDSD